MNAAGKIALILTLLWLLTAAAGHCMAQAFAPQNVLADISRQFAQTEDEWKRPLTDRLESLESRIEELREAYPLDPRLVVWHTTVLTKLQRWSQIEEESLRFISEVRDVPSYQKAQIYHRLIYASWRLGGIRRILETLRRAGAPPFYLWVYLFGNIAGTAFFALATWLSVAKKDRKLLSITIMWMAVVVTSALWGWGWTFLAKASSPSSSHLVWWGAELSSLALVVSLKLLIARWIDSRYSVAVPNIATKHRRLVGTASIAGLPIYVLWNLVIVLPMLAPRLRWEDIAAQIHWADMLVTCLALTLDALAWAQLIGACFLAAQSVLGTLVGTIWVWLLYSCSRVSQWYGIADATSQLGWDLGMVLLMIGFYVWTRKRWASAIPYAIVSSTGDIIALLRVVAQV